MSTQEKFLTFSLTGGSVSSCCETRIFGTQQNISLGLQGAALKAAAQPQHCLGTARQAAPLQNPKWVTNQSPPLTCPSELPLAWHLGFAAWGNDSSDTGGIRRWWHLACKWQNWSFMKPAQIWSCQSRTWRPSYIRGVISVSWRHKGVWNTTQAATAALKSLKEFYFWKPVSDYSTAKTILEKQEAWRNSPIYIRKYWRNPVLWPVMTDLRLLFSLTLFNYFPLTHTLFISLEKPLRPACRFSASIATVHEF